MADLSQIYIWVMSKACAPVYLRMRMNMKMMLGLGSYLTGTIVLKED